MPAVKCSVANCSFWAEGNECSANSIQIDIDEHAKATSGDAEFASDFGSSHEDQASSVAGTCCHTFQPKLEPVPRHDVKETAALFQQQEFRQEAGDPAPDRVADTEAAAELAPHPASFRTHELRRNAGEEDYSFDSYGSLSRIVGWTALALSVVAMFYFPLLFGAAAVLFGVLAFVGGSRALGGWATGLGLLAVVAHFFIIPYYS
ncbi:DUF1540 domain-containing protein [Paenibacillus cymbidii]|uniref:DUF1540 domain-containing protein n=1 Tax=Paenibacillus cymbidii TaxID=1639034 RepID=UPI001081CE70|nr:DUF1540 domain-containing protein [Paenibacillus cymbidii]